MCGRYTLTAAPGVLGERFEVAFPDSAGDRYNVAPGQAVPIIRRAESGELETALVRWGLIPHWAKDASAAYRMVNARAETLLERPAYRTLVADRRCVIPADGFYEWMTRPDGRRQAVRYTVDGGRLFGFAGLWTRWVDRNTAEVIESCTIITCDSNELAAQVHVGCR